MTIRISIVEDDAPIRQALEQYINRAAGFECVSAYEYPRVALRQLPLDKPDVVLMDLQLPGMSGIECVAALRRQSPAIRVIMLTVFERDEQIFESLAAGAYGYLVKRTSPAKILDAIRGSLWRHGIAGAKMKTDWFWCCRRARPVLPCACEDINRETSRSAVCRDLPRGGAAQGAQVGDRAGTPRAGSARRHLPVATDGGSRSQG